MDPEKIKGEILSSLMNFFTDPEHLEEQFQNLDSYLETLSDVSKSSPASESIAQMQMNLALLLAMLTTNKQFAKTAHEMEKKINYLTEKIVRLQKQLN